MKESYSALVMSNHFRTYSLFQVNRLIEATLRPVLRDVILSEAKDLKLTEEPRLKQKRFFRP